ncbi:MAG: hypothetical protein PUK70_07870 [Bacteroidales bacterium]|nr:hypothetical protein [Bacteroidales bacterium]MDY6001052.1 hypothetical protein [Candidatus Cryptobacteroides sp.]
MKAKALILAIAALFIASTTSFAQQKEEESASTTLQFMKSSGSFLVKEFYDLAVIKGVTCKVLIITDVVSNKKMGCMRLETEYSSSYSSSPDTYVGTLDADELDACIRSLTYLKDNILSKDAETYTEAQYTSRDKVEIGAYFNESKKKWTAYVQTKSYTSRSMEFFEAANLDALAAEMQKAKDMILEKTK